MPNGGCFSMGKNCDFTHIPQPRSRRHCSDLCFFSLILLLDLGAGGLQKNKTTS